MMQPATIAMPVQPVPIPQPPVQQTAPVVIKPAMPSKPLLADPPPPLIDQVYHTFGTVNYTEKG